jgi:predicted kinase
MNNLVILRGLPASGKTVYSMSYVRQNYKRINLDDLRNMIDNGVYSKSNEAYITDLAQTATALALQSGFNVIFDACNLNPYHIKFAKALCRDTRSTLDIIDIKTPLDICIARDLARNYGRVGRDVIIKMHSRWVDSNGEFPPIED